MNIVYTCKVQVLSHIDHVTCLSVPAGIRSWDINVSECDLDQQLQLFITRHSAQFSAEVRGQSD